MNYGLTLVTPGAEPVTVAEFKQHARINRIDEDPLIEAFLRAAREYCETHTRRQLSPATWRMTLDRFPACEIRLPLPPLQSVTSITYVDGNGDVQTLAADRYEVDASSQPGRIHPAYGYSWPITREQLGSVNVTFVAGYSDVPATITTAIKLLAAHYYENREAVTAGALTEVPLAVESLLLSEHWGSL